MRSLTLMLVAVLLLPVSLTAEPPPANVEQSVDGENPADIVDYPNDELLMPAHLEVRDVLLSEAFRQLGATSGVPLAFSPSLLPKAPLVSCPCSNASVEEALSDLLRGTNFEFAILGQQVIVRESQIPTMHTTREDEYMRPRDVDRSVVRTSNLALRTIPIPSRTGTIRGQVVDGMSLRPLASVQVYIPSLDLGSITGSDGTFVLSPVPAGTHLVRADLLGYERVTQEVEVRSGETSELTLQMSSQALALDELVVTATGLQRVREIGHATSTIEAGEIVEQIQPMGVEQLLQSRASGVSVQTNTGTIGAANDLKIRGAASLSLSNRPLVYVDGARINTAPVEGGVSGQSYSRLNDLNPNDIESIEIVKGPAASTLYGTEAAGGVIRITTKQGASGTTTYRVRMEYGANWDDNDYLPTVWNPRSFFGEAAKDTLYEMSFIDAGGDPFRTGLERTFAVDAQGGGDGINYFLAGQWSDRQGATFRNETEGYNFRANLSGQPGENLGFSVSNAISNRMTALPHADNSGNGFIALAYIGFPWTMPIEARDPNDPGSGLIRTCPENVEQARISGESLADLGFSGCREKPGFGGRNQADLRTLTTSNHTLRYTGSAELTYQPIERWTTRATAGYDYMTDRWNRLWPVDPDRPFGGSSDGRLDNRQVRSQNLTLEGTSSLNFDVTSDLHTVATVGFQYFRDYLEQVEARGDIFPAGSAAVNNAVLTSGSDFHNEIKTLGLFVQSQFGWRDRLFVTPAVRFDRNSAFGPELGLKTYPKVSASWILSDEAFAPELFEMLRLRLAWGMSGKQPSSNDALGLLSPIPVIQEGDEILGVQPNRPGNVALKPETGKELEFGVDLRTWQGRLGIDLTAYFQTTSDALVQRPLPASGGFPGARWENVAELKNRGLEVGINVTAVNRPNLSSDWNLVFSRNTNEVTRLEEMITFSVQRHMEGYPFGGYWERPIFIDEAGEVRIGEEEVFLGPSLPVWEGALSHTLRLFGGNVALHGNLAFAGGHQHYNASEERRCWSPVGGRYGGICPAAHERNPDGSFTDRARIIHAGSEGRASQAAWIEDGDWLKLRTLALSIDLPARWVEITGANGATFRVVTENVATWSNYSGLDPEIRRHGPAASEAARREFYTAPPLRRVLTSLSITF